MSFTRAQTPNLSVNDPVRGPLDPASLLVNYDEAKIWHENSSGGGAKLTGGVSANYVIITTDAIRSASSKLAEFIKHKQDMGYSVAVKTEADWGGGTGNAAAENIRNWLRSNYLTMGIEYVLLIGNPDPNCGDVPMKLMWPRNNATTNRDWRDAPSDYYYADLTGNWDRDGDGYFGEEDDDFGTGGIDRIPEVIVGRIPSYTSWAGELDKILQKSVDYEDTPQGDWVRRALLPMKPSDQYTPGYHLGEAIRSDILIPAEFPSSGITRVYESTYGLSPAPEVYPCNEDNVIAAWKNKASVVFWWTHGNSSSAMDVMSYWGCEELDDSCPSFTFQSSCLNGCPENEANLGYALLRNGAVATDSASRVSWYGIGETTFTHTGTNDGITYQYAKKLILDRQTCGQSHFSALQSVPASFWMNHCVFNIYGDPSVRLALQAPEVTSVQPNVASNTAPVGVAIYGDRFRSGCTVRLRKAGQSDIVATDVTVASTVIGCSFDLTGKASGSWDLAISGPDGAPIVVNEAFQVAGTFASWNLDTSPGWAMTGQWQYGSPSGLGGTVCGYPDPTSGKTGTKAYGVNLSGDYSTTAGDANYLTTTAIDCSAYRDVQLKFERWLNTDQNVYVNASIEASTDAMHWTRIWSNAADWITDDAWVECCYDVSFVADYSPTLYLRWGHQVKSRWNAGAFSGWNVDDIQLTGVRAAHLAPTITSITPDTEYNDNPAAAFTLTGTNFRTGTHVILQKFGEADIAATSVATTGPNQMVCTFDLTGKSMGSWDVVLIDRDGKSAVLPGGLTVAALVAGWDFETNPGWDAQGQWEFGRNSGAWGATGNPDPVTGKTGMNMYGVNLNGDYSSTPVGPFYLTTGAIDCTGYSEVQLRFWRYLNSDPKPFVDACIEASADGVSWTQIWDVGESSIVEDSDWVFCSYDISSVAKDSRTVFVRWGYQVLQNLYFWGSYWTRTGWNVDDVEIAGIGAVRPPPTVTSINPNSGLNNGTTCITQLSGTGFLSGATVKLTRSGQSDIVAANVTLVSPSEITCSFDLDGRAPGQWNVLVTNLDGKSGVLTNGFTVGAPALSVSSIEPGTASNNGVVSITNLAGASFESGATVHLAKAYQSDIPASSITVVSSTQITCQFDLSGRTTGAWDVVVTNPSGTSATLTSGFLVTAPVVSWDFETDPGWSTQGEWQFGVPAGCGGEAHGMPDPTSGFTGQKVYGVNLGGDYSTADVSAQYLTTGPIDCTGFGDLVLRSHRWLNSDFPPYVRASLEVSKDGSNWTGVWSNPTLYTITDAAWVPCSYSIGSIANNQSTVFLRWGHQVNSTHNAWAYSGWNIDDVEIVGTEIPVVTSVAPNTAPNTGAVRITEIAGRHFRPGASVRLAKSGEADIIAAEVSVASTGKISCSFDLHSKVAGKWDMVVTSSDGASGVLEDGFTIVDALAPSVTVNQASDQLDPTSASPVRFTVVFSQPVSGFATGDVTLSGTAGAGTAIVTGSGTTYSVAVSGMTGSGTVIASIATGIAQDAHGNPNDASTSADNTVTYKRPPQNVSITPSGGTLGTSPLALTALYRNVRGFADIRRCYLLLSDTLAQTNAAMAMYDRVTNRLYLKNDANTSWGTGYAPGANITLQNSQCDVYVKDTTVSGDGNNLTVDWRIALKSAFLARNLNAYLYVQDAGGLTDGWDLMGRYYNVKPEALSIAPNSGALPMDTRTTLTSLYQDLNGYADLRKCYLLVNDSLAQTNAILMLYDKATNKLYLKNDANTSWGTGYAPGTDVTLTNGQCEAYVKDTTVSGTGNELTVAWSLRLKPSMTGKNLYTYMYVTDSKAAYEGWKKVGTHFTPTAPICVSVTPSTGKVQSGTPLVFTTEYADDNGCADIYQCHFQMGQTGSYANAVYLLYDAKQNKVFLRNDGNTSWGTGYAPGTDVTLENSQCIVHVKDTTVTPSGSDGLLIDWKITLKPVLVGKLLGERMFCRDNEIMSSGWKLKGYVRAQ